jgi:hypothetical protein
MESYSLLLYPINDLQMKSQTIILATSITAIALVATFLAAMVLLQPASADSPAAVSTQGPPQSWGGPNMTSSGQFRRGGGPPGFFGGGLPPGGFPAIMGPPANLTVGQTITLTSTSGQYVVVNDSGVNGTATGTFTLTVTGKLAEGYTLSITSGSISINGTTYTISSGSAETSPPATALQGQGSTSSSGEFLLQAQARGSFAGSNATANIDLKAGSSEYMILLMTTVQG